MGYFSLLEQPKGIFKTKNENKARIFNEIAEALENEELYNLSDEAKEWWRKVLKEIKEDDEMDVLNEATNFMYRLSDDGEIDLDEYYNKHYAEDLLVYMLYVFSEVPNMLIFTSEDSDKWGYYIIPNKGIFNMEYVWEYFNPDTNKWEEVKI